MAFRMNYRGNQGFTLGPLGFLIVANIIVFIVTSIRPPFIYYLGLSGSDFLSQPWTIVTTMFVHANIGHIFANMLTLYFYGSYLINLVGERDFFIVYFLGGLAGGALFLLLASPLSIAVGASGAIFAVGGALAVLRPKEKVFVFPIPVPIQLWIVIIGGFFIMTSPGIAWQAHLGGLLLGAGAGYYFRRTRRIYF
jgi:membrane associated rhomboid family serine protease